MKWEPCECIIVKHRDRCNNTGTFRCNTCGATLCGGCAKNHHAHSDVEKIQDDLQLLPVGDGITDDTAAIQAGIDRQRGLR